VGWQQAAPENVLGCCHHPLDFVRSCVRENAFWFRTRWEMAVSGIISGSRLLANLQSCHLSKRLPSRRWMHPR
jgi:hypothetical protein